MKDDLIYDVGMHNGDDSAYYLSRGYRVVAIEANPELAATAKRRFENELSSGKLVIINAGIFQQTGKRTFWVNRTHSVASSFDEEMASKWGGEVSPISVDCIRFEDILREHGVPFYLKIDIEGADSECLSALQTKDLPQFVSAEAHSIMPLCQMFVLGFRQFKCMNQRYHNCPQMALNAESQTRRFTRQAIRLAKGDLATAITKFSLTRPIWEAARRWRKNKVRNQRIRMKATFKDKMVSGEGASQNGKSISEAASHSHFFPEGSSGPFGDMTFGEWKSFEEITYNWLHLNYGRTLLSNYVPGRYDFHARLDSNPT